MSTQEQYNDDHQPRMESWLWVACASFVPIMLALLLPRSLMIPLYVASGVILAISVLMLVRVRRRG